MLGTIKVDLPFILPPASSPRNTFLCFMWSEEETEVISLTSNKLVFVIDMQYVLYDLGTEFLNII
jgi:hypothetical protein